MGNRPTTIPQPTTSRPSAGRRRSSGSVRIAWLDRKQAIAERAERARARVAGDPRLGAGGLFGSLARGEALPSSDTDRLIALPSHPQARWSDRIPEYADAFTGTSLPVDLFPDPLDEPKGLAAHSGFLRAAPRDFLPLAGHSAICSQLAEAEPTADRQGGL